MHWWYNYIFFCDPRQWIFPCDDGDNKGSEVTKEAVQSQQTLEEKVLLQKTVTVPGTKSKVRCIFFLDPYWVLRSWTSSWH